MHAKVVTDVILQAGGIREEGLSTGIEVSRADTTSIEVYSTVRRLDLPAEDWSAQGEREFLLQDLDHVLVPFDPRHSPQQFVDISGYVMFPGRYAILNANERLSSLIRRAGGLKPGAYQPKTHFLAEVAPWNSTPSSSRSASSPSKRSSSRRARSARRRPTTPATTCSSCARTTC